MQNVKSKLPPAIGLVFAVLVVLDVLFSGGTWNRASATPSQITTQNIAATSTFSITSGQLASTTLSFMSAGLATTTYQIDSNSADTRLKPNFSMAQIDSADVYILFNASTSGSILTWQYQFSNNNVDWYAEGQNIANPITGTASTTNGFVVQNASSTIHMWSPGVSGNSFTVVSAPALPGYHERIVFSIPMGSPAGAVYAEIDTKKNPSNP